MNESEKEREERRRVLVELLDHWKDFFDEPASSGLVVVDEQTKQTAENWSLFSAMQRWPAVVEMRRCVELMGRMAPGHYRQLMAYTAYVDWRLVDKPVKRLNAHRKLVDDIERVRERIVPSWVVPQMVDRALDFVVGVWRFPQKDCDACQGLWLEGVLVRCKVHAALVLPPGMQLKLREFVNPETGETGWTEAA